MRRLVFAGLLMLFGFTLASIAPLFFARLKDDLGWLFLGLGAAAMFAHIPVAVRATTCPQCGVRWLGFAMSHLRVNEWLQWLVSMQRCPKCGYGERP